MPSNPCPHCPLKFLSRDTLQTHITFVHHGGPQSIAQSSTTPLTTPARSGFISQTQAAQPTAAGPSTTTAAGPTTQAMPPPPITPASPIPAQSPYQPVASGSVANTFMILFDTRNLAPQTMTHIPVNEPFTAFMDRLTTLSAPIAGRYIAGREDGFTLEDGAWRYALVHHDGAREEARRLDRNLFYLAMVSELRCMGTPYRHAVVWHDAQDGIETTPGEGQQESSQGQRNTYDRGVGMGTGPTTTTYQTATHQMTTAYQQPPQQQGPGQARTPQAIRQRREESGRVEYLVGFLEGGPERWMGREELMGGGGGVLVEDWERRYHVSGS